MEALRLADHPALEFFNSTFSPGGTTHELIGDGRALLGWLVDVGLLGEADASRMKRRFGMAALDDVAVEAQELRRWSSAWIERWRLLPNADYEDEVTRVNDFLSRANDTRGLTRRGEAFEIFVRRRDRSPCEILAMLAYHIAALVAYEDPSLIRRCAGSACTLWFLDRTKAHRRRFCSVAACGNREKVAAFRERQRAARDASNK
jgi:hypothetical protein